MGRNFSLTNELGSFVDKQVKTGRNVSGSKVVREALRRYRDDISREQAHLDYFKKLAETGEVDIASGHYVELTTPDSVRAHIRNSGIRRSDAA